MKLLARVKEPDSIPLLIIFGGGPDREGHHLKVVWFGHPIGFTIIFIWVVILGFSSWIVASRMRRRIKDDLGIAANEGDLSSIETWMKVDEAEQKKNPGRDWAPESSPSDYESSKRDL